jgi:hypothetical protein
MIIKFFLPTHLVWIDRKTPFVHVRKGYRVEAGIASVRPRSDGAFHMDDIDRAEVEQRKILSRHAPAFNYSRCASCGLPWWVNRGHIVQYSVRSGCFAVCEMCWSQVPREELWPMYKLLLQRHGDEAVRAGYRVMFGTEML